MGYILDWYGTILTNIYIFLCILQLFANHTPLKGRRGETSDNNFFFTSSSKLAGKHKCLSQLFSNFIGTLQGSKLSVLSCLVHYVNI